MENRKKMLIEMMVYVVMIAIGIILMVTKPFADETVHPIPTIEPTSSPAYENTITDDMRDD